MSAFKLFLSLLSVTFLASVSWSAAGSTYLGLQISCASPTPIGEGKVEVSGSVEMEKSELTGKTIYRTARLWLCDENVSKPCAFVKLSPEAGRYSFNQAQAVHEIELMVLNSLNGNRLLLKMAVQSVSAMEGQIQSLVPPSDSFLNLTSKHIAVLNCSAKDLNDISALRAIKGLMSPDFWLSFLIN